MALEVAIVPYTQDPNIKETYNVIGKRGLRRCDGYDKASGRALFPRDLFSPGNLWARVMASPYPHARVKSLDTTAAEALPGVKYILRCDDPNPMVGAFICPSEPLHEGEACCAAVVADTEDIAEEALRLIEVEWEELPFALDAEDALKPDMPVLWSNRSIFAFGIPTTQNLLEGTSLTCYITDWEEPGEVEVGFQESDQIIEFHWSREENLQCASSHGALAKWGNIRSNQQSEGPVEQWYNYTPGTYGAGGMTAFTCSKLVTYLAAMVGKDVKFSLHPRQSLAHSMSDDCGTVNVKVGFKNDGTIMAVQIDTMYNGRTIQSGGWFLQSNTRIPNLKVNYKGAHVDRPMTMACRSEMRVNTTTLDMVTHHVAAALNMDPIEVALKNDGHEGHDMAWLSQFKLDHGFKDIDSLQDCVSHFKAAIDWDNKWHEPGTKQLSNGNMHGMGFTWANNWASTEFAGDVGIYLHSGGKANIIAIKSEYGCNQATWYCMAAAEAVGLKYEDVYMRSGHPYDSFTPWQQGGSGGTAPMSYALQRAGAKLKELILELACLEHEIPRSLDGCPYQDMLTVHSLFPGLSPEDLDVKDSIIFEKANPDNKVPVAAAAAKTALYPFFGMHAGNVFASAFQGQGIYGESVDRPEMSRQAHAGECEVDPETGLITVKKVVFVNDVGRAMNPTSVEAQQHGAGIMGLSRALMEEFVYDKLTGVKLNDNYVDYKFATLRDIEEVETIFLENELGYGGYGCTGIGENCSDSAGCIVNSALYNATGKWVTDFPITPDKVLKALGKA